MFHSIGSCNMIHSIGSCFLHNSFKIIHNNNFGREILLQNLLLAGIIRNYIHINQIENEPVCSIHVRGYLLIYIKKKKRLENVLLNEKFKVQNNLSSKLYLYKSRGRTGHI